MSEAQVGVRAFFIDGLSSPMGLATTAMFLLGQSLVGMSGEVGAGEMRMRALGDAGFAMSTEMASLSDGLLLYNEQFALGNITLEEAATATTYISEEQRLLQQRIDENASAMVAEDTAARELTSTIGTLGFTFGAAIDFVGFALGLKAVDDAAAQLTDTINNLSIAGDLTQTQTDQMTQSLYTLASSSTYTADIVGQGFTELLAKGQSTDDIIKYLGQDMINLAMATGQSGAAESARLLGSVLREFSIPANQARQITDQLTYAFYHGGESISNMTSGIAAVAPIAHALNVPFSEMLANLITLTQSGLSFSQAATAMRYELTSMYEPTQKQANELEYLGIITARKATPALLELEKQMVKAGGAQPDYKMTIDSLYTIFNEAKAVGAINVNATFLQWASGLGVLSNKFYDAKGKMIDFQTAQGILITQIQKTSKTPEDFALAMGQMFNVRSGQAMAILINHVHGLNATTKLLALTTEKQGLAAEDAAKHLNSQGSATKALGTTITDFMAQAGKPVQDLFQHIAEKLNTFFTSLTTGSPAVHQFLTAFLTFGTIVGGIAAVVGVVMLLTALLGALGIALGPILAVVGIIVAAAAVFALLWMWLSRVKPVIDFVGMAFHQLGMFIQNLKIGQTFGELSKTVKELLNQLAPLLPVLKVIAIVIGVALLAAVVGVIAILFVLAKVITVALVVAMQILGGAIRVLSWAFEQLGKLGSLVFGALGTNASNAGNQIGNVFSFIGRVVSIAIGTFQHMGSAIGGVFSHIGVLASNFVQGAFQWGANLIQMIINGIMSKFSSIGNAVSNIGSLIHGILGIHSPAETGPLSTADTWMPNMMNMMTAGITAGSPRLRAAAMGAAAGIHSGINAGTGSIGAQGSFGVGSGSGSGQPGTINFNVDGKTYEQIVVQGLTRELAAAGIHRTMR